MNPIRIAAVSRSVQRLPSRRCVLRALVGLGIGVEAFRPPDAARARNGKKRKKRKPCPRGRRIGAVTVRGSGVAATTPVLKRGQRYRLRASGYWFSNVTRGQDAFADFSLVDPSDHVTDYEGVRLGLAVDGASPDLWGSYDSGHEYERVVTGRGAALSLRCSDAVYADNNGTVLVEVFCA